MQGQLLQDPMRLGSKRQKNLPAVFPAPITPHETARSQSLNEIYCAVVLYLQAVGHLRHSRPCAVRQTRQRQQQLVLTRFHPGSTRRLLTKVQETADVVSQLS